MPACHSCRRAMSQIPWDARASMTEQPRWSGEMISPAKEQITAGFSMSELSRRSVLRGSVRLAPAGTLGRPFIADASGKTATVWWVQGFVREEDASFKNMVAE